MEKILVLLLLWLLLFTLLRRLNQSKFPIYFRNESMRVVPGKDDEEYYIEVIAIPDASNPRWTYRETIYGWEKVQAYMKEQDRRYKAYHALQKEPRKPHKK